MRPSGERKSFLDECAGTHSLALSKIDLSQIEERPDQVLLIVSLPVVTLALSHQRASFRIVALADSSNAEKMEQVGEVSCVSHIPGKRTALLKQEADLVVITVRQGKPP